jgi:putative ABC transport system substrate-binding protein
MLDIRRRQFITLLGGAAAAWPFAARAQQPERVRRIGVLMNMAEDDPEAQIRLAAFRQSLLALGWAENRNIRIDYRFVGGDAARVHAHAAELVSSAPDLIVAHTSPVVAALKAATHAIPVIFAVLNDPVRQGVITSLARPGGNITGFTYIDFEMVGKWLEMLTEIAPTSIYRRAHLVSRNNLVAALRANLSGRRCGPASWPFLSTSTRTGFNRSMSAR